MEGCSGISLRKKSTIPLNILVIASTDAIEFAPKAEKKAQINKGLWNLPFCLNRSCPDSIPSLFFVFPFRASLKPFNDRLGKPP